MLTYDEKKVRARIMKGAPITILLVIWGCGGNTTECAAAECAEKHEVDSAIAEAVDAGAFSDVAAPSVDIVANDAGSSTELAFGDTPSSEDGCCMTDSLDYREVDHCGGGVGQSEDEAHAFCDAMFVCKTSWCQAGACVHSESHTCFDPSPCVIASCDPQMGCVYDVVCDE